MDKFYSSNHFETKTILYENWNQNDVIKKWDDGEIAKAIDALRKRFIGTEEYQTRSAQPILLKTDRSMTMNIHEDNTTILAFATFQIKDFKLTEIKIGDHEVILEKPNRLVSHMIVEAGKNRGQQSFEEIRNGVRLAIEEFCIGSEELELRHRGLHSRSNGSYTLNYHEDNVTYLGQVHYKVENFKVNRIVIGQGFEDTPQVRAAFEGYDL